MNNQHVKGGINQAKGRVKEEVGHLTGNNRLAGEGVVDRIKGKVQEAVGDLKDGVKRRIDSALDDKEKCYKE